jgi:hypothetical protein
MELIKVKEMSVEWFKINLIWQRMMEITKRRKGMMNEYDFKQFGNILYPLFVCNMETILKIKPMIKLKN